MAVRIISTLEKRPSAFSAYEDAQDDQLIRLLQLGYERAFETLMNRHRGIVWRAVKQYMGNLNEVEDIYQDASLSFYQNCQNYRVGEAKFSTWLYRVVANRCLDILRSKKASGNNKELDDLLPSNAPTGEDDLNRREVSRQLKGLLAELPLQQRLAVSLYYYEEKEISDISGLLSVSDIATRSLIKRGKEKMRELGSAINF
jgi:RNA polymerase sigma-70 factor (ECF subfamily)